MPAFAASPPIRRLINLLRAEDTAQQVHQVRCSALCLDLAQAAHPIYSEQAHEPVQGGARSCSSV